MYLVESDTNITYRCQLLEGTLDLSQLFRQSSACLSGKPVPSLILYGETEDMILLVQAKAENDTRQTHNPDSVDWSCMVQNLKAKHASQSTDHNARTSDPGLSEDFNRFFNDNHPITRRIAYQLNTSEQTLGKLGFGIGRA